MSSTIKAAVCRAHGAPLTIEDVTLRAPEGREVEVTLDAVAICHSDISYADGEWGGDLPAVYGHEVAGRVSAVGVDAEDFEIGAPVIATLLRACGTCPACAAGRAAYCQAPRNKPSPLTDTQGETLLQPLQIGGFAEKVVVDRSQVERFASTMCPSSAALLACGVITGVGAVVNTAKLRPGEDAVVIGAGGVGLNSIQGARMSGARRIIAVDMVPEKLEAAKEFGATHGVLASNGAPWDEIAAILGKGADAVFVTVGAAIAFTTAPNYLAQGGRIVMVGMPPVGAKSEYEPVNLASQGQGMIGSKMGDVVLSRDIPWLVDLHMQGRLKLDEMVSKTWALSEINKAIADTKSGAARRNVIVF